MQIQITKNFIRQAKKLPKSVQIDIKEVIEIIIHADNLQGVKGIKRLKAKAEYYRIGIGDYRLGIEMLEDTIVSFKVVGHRRLIYNTFPQSN